MGQRGERQRRIWADSSIRTFFWVMKWWLESRVAKSRSSDICEKYLLKDCLQNLHFHVQTTDTAMNLRIRRLDKGKISHNPSLLIRHHCNSNRCLTPRSRYIVQLRSLTSMTIKPTPSFPGSFYHPQPCCSQTAHTFMLQLHSTPRKLAPSCCVVVYVCMYVSVYPCSMYVSTLAFLFARINHFSRDLIT